MTTNRSILFILLLFNTLLVNCQLSKALINGHAHNDYFHDQPLITALANGFISVEADVHLKEGKLIVTHDDPLDPSKFKTLEQLYLDPLFKLVKENHGRVYKKYEGFFYLMIDFKTEANATYEALNEVLSNYTDMISVVSDSTDQKHKPIKVFISGNRPIDMFMKTKNKLAGLDGRPNQIGSNIPISYMPFISDNISNFITIEADSQSKTIDTIRLKQFVHNAHLEGKKVRLWGAPDDIKTWTYLLNIGVDLINTDKISDFAEFIKDYKL